jgi:hypothetical protein
MPASVDGAAARVVLHAADGAFVATVWLSGKGERSEECTVGAESVDVTFD